MRLGAQGSSFLATLGFELESLWDSNFRKAFALAQQASPISEAPDKVEKKTFISVNRFFRKRRHAG